MTAPGSALVSEMTRLSECCSSCRSHIVGDILGLFVLGGGVHGRTSRRPSSPEAYNSFRSVRRKQPGDIGNDLQSKHRSYAARMHSVYGADKELNPLSAANARATRIA